ncbi:EF-hand domain-containing protein [Alteromonas sp. ASW11-19]|uniref:EF-hand domain-containing protein n=1 Tax=Alteromonas salexigens TaxID=2982530 RepID=A0ABT2VTM0_9ALTE|nr:EF-hand domain-containing protein [Alteromonas salexigens]MCU7555209.1 EF-hand domain-containing protein [Alteromonas salexigens]
MKRMEKMFLILLTVAAIQAVSVASAHADEHGELMTQLDSDQDGLISLKEAVRNTELLRNFGLIDQNEDGLLSMDELLASELTPSGQRMES